MFEGLFQPMHLLVILGIALLVFGPKKLPELGKGLGEGIRGFKNSFNGAEATAPTPATRGEDAFGSRSLAESSDFPQRTPSRSETI
jgi:sec-independent protein translocase protein TatA